MKACFGQLANISVKYNHNTKKHFLRVDQEKLKECDHCHLFTKCMFVRYNELFQQMLNMLDEQGEGGTRRI